MSYARTLLATLGVAALGLASCNADEPSGAPAGHTLTTEAEGAVSPPPSEARSSSSALVGAVAAPAAAAQSARYRLVTTGLQPKLRR